MVRVPNAAATDVGLKALVTLMPGRRYAERVLNCLNSVHIQPPHTSKLRQQGNHQRALELVSKALQLTSEQGPQHPELALDVNTMAMVQWKLVSASFILWGPTARLHTTA